MSSAAASLATRGSPLPPPASTNLTNPLISSPVVDAHTTRVDVINTAGGRILCVADIRGAISSLNALALEHSASAIIHTGDFGFFEPQSLNSISERTLRHLIQYSSLISSQFRSQLLAPSTTLAQIRHLLAHPPRGSSATGIEGNNDFFGLSEFPKLLSGHLKLNVPVYSIWGACEDVSVVEKIRMAGPSQLSTAATTTTSKSNQTGSRSPYAIHNLTVLDEATTRSLVIGGVKLRLFGLGGAIVSHKLFDNGTGAATIAGGNGTMWTTILQIGELVDTAQKVYDPTETRLLISHASPGREGLISQLCLVLKIDLTISGGLHFRYGSSYNEFSVQHDPEAFKHKLESATKSFNEVWDTVKAQVEGVVDETQRRLLRNALTVANRAPASSPAGAASMEETTWKNTWNWNLPDVAFGSLILDVREGRVGCEMKSQGFNFAYRQHAPKAIASIESPVSASVAADVPVATSTPVTSSTSTTPAPASTPLAPTPLPPTGPRYPNQRQHSAHLSSTNTVQPLNPLQHRAFPAPSAQQYSRQQQEQHSLQRGGIHAILNQNALPSSSSSSPASSSPHVHRPIPTAPHASPATNQPPTNHNNRFENRSTSATGPPRFRNNTTWQNGTNAAPSGTGTGGVTGEEGRSARRPATASRTSSEKKLPPLAVVPKTGETTTATATVTGETGEATTPTTIPSRPASVARNPRGPRAGSAFASRTGSPAPGVVATLVAGTAVVVPMPSSGADSSATGENGSGTTNGEAAGAAVGGVLGAEGTPAGRGGRGGLGRGGARGGRGGRGRASGSSGDLTPGAGFVPRTGGRGGKGVRGGLKNGESANTGTGTTGDSTASSGATPSATVGGGGGGTPTVAAGSSSVERKW